jgi:hypothetical protein
VTAEPPGVLDAVWPSGERSNGQSTPDTKILRGARVMATSGRGRSSFSDSGAGDPASRLGKPVYHVKKSQADSDLFTESAFVYTAKTWWARLTSRTALETYEGTLNHFVALVILTAETMAAIVVAVSKRAWVVGVQVARVGVQVGGAVIRAVLSRSRTAGGAVAGGVRATGGAIAGSARGAWGLMSGGARATRSVVAGGARATRSAVAGGARTTKGAVAGGARLTRRTVARGRASGRAKRDPVGSTQQVDRLRAPADQRTATARPGSRPVRSAGAARSAQTVKTRSATKTTDAKSRPVPESSPAQARADRPAASPRQGQAARPATQKVAQRGSDVARGKPRPNRDVTAGSAPAARAARGGARPRSAAAATASLKAEQVFVGRAEPRAKQKKARKRIGLATRGRQVAGILLSVARLGAARAWRLLLGCWFVIRRGLRLLSPALRWTSRRWQYAAIPVAISMLALMLTPIGWDVVGDFSWRGSPPASVESPAPVEAPGMAGVPATVESPPATAETPAPMESPVMVESPATVTSEPAGSKLASQNRTASEESDPGLSLPKISLPRLSGPLITLPSISWPAFVRGPVEKVDRLLSGALVEPGSRVLVADVTDRLDKDEQLGLVLGLVLEAELARGRDVTVPQRERTLIIANGSAEAASLALPATRALSLAASTGSSAIITSELTVEDSVRVLAVVVHDEVGDELHRFTLEVDQGSLLEVVGQAAKRLAAKLGEPTASGQDQLAPAPFLTRSLPAARAYAEARAHLYRSDYRQAIEAARGAIAHDSAFAAAHRLMAEALGLRGQRVRARQSLDAAWQFRDRLTERERLRLVADRDALAGRHSEAILGYDHLFSQFRDDAAALRCQAILQEMVGVRGGGDGNLRVAYTIDPVDWPPLERVAAFLGYSGRIPEVAGRPPADSE